MSEAGQRLRVFISYARRDGAAFASQLLAGLEGAGFDPFLDLSNGAAGDDWKAPIGEEIAASDVMVFIVSPGALASSNCAWEVETAWAHAKRVIHVVAPDAPLADAQALADVVAALRASPPPRGA